MKTLSAAGRRGGLIGFFVHHRNAGNLLMAAMLVVGAFALARLNTQFFPDFGIDVVEVQVEWPGASAEDVDANIVAAIEPEVRFLDSVKRVRSTSYEGLVVIFVEFVAGADMQKALSDVESAVGQVTTLPEDSEAPEIRRIVRYDTVSRIIVSGPFPEAALKATAKRIREDLLDRGIDRVTFFGARDEEILVEVTPEALRRLDLSLQDIAERVGASSMDLPSGTVEGTQVKQLRSEGLAETAAEVAGIEVTARERGERVLMRDVARITEHFDEDAPVALHDGQPAIQLTVLRSVTADALEQQAIMQAYLKELKPTLPPGLLVEEYDVLADLINQRIWLLLENGLTGLILVLGVLFLFLRWRLAFWVAVGIPVSLMATMVVMLGTGQSINMVSLFAMIMALGIVVDDAIVVGEHALSRFERGVAPSEAAIRGALRMLPPVLAASLTTVAAFLPIMLIGDIIGQIMSAIPLVIISVIAASLIECFFVLPHHMKWALEAEARSAEKPPGRMSRVRERLDGAFAWFRDGPYRRALQGCVRWRYLTVASALAVLVLTFGLINGGRVGFVFFPSPEADVIEANVSFPDGSPRATTAAMLTEMKRALDATEDRLTGGEGGLVRFAYERLGSGLARSSAAGGDGDHRGSILVELLSSDQRAVRTSAVVEAWRAELRPMPGIEKLTLTARRGGPPGREIDVRLSGDVVSDLKAAAEEVKAELARFTGVSDVADDLPYGKQELTLEVTPRGRALGFTTASVGRQVRNAFEGAVAKRFARGDEEVTVRVRYPLEAVTEQALRRLHLRGPSGAEVPLAEVARLTESVGFSRITREDGAREVAITGEIDEDRTNAIEVQTALERGVLPRIARDFGVAFEFKGKAEERRTTFADMRLGAMIGLVGIYLVLAWVFASYSRPLVVMSIIPFGLIGATVGHIVMGFDLTILSMVALLGLSGILVNDSIILVTSIDDRSKAGEPVHEAVVAGSQDRLRAVILTSLTTIGGLLPLMFETSFQAQFLIPIAITMVFGLLVATVLVLVLVPCVVAVVEDLRALVWRRPAPGPAAAE